MINLFAEARSFKNKEKNIRYVKNSLKRGQLYLTVLHFRSLPA
jgi:hypothetical protein